VTFVAYNVSDTAAHLSVAIPADLDEVLGSVSVSDFADVSEAALLTAFDKAITFSVADTATAIAGSNADNNYSEASSIIANTEATAAEAATMAGYTKAVTFDTADTIANLVANLTSNNLTEARTIGDVIANDANADFVTALTTGASNMNYLTNFVELIRVNDDTALTVNAQQFVSFLAGSVELETTEGMTIAGDGITPDIATIGTLSAYGGNGTLTLGVAAGADAYNINLGTSGVTNVFLEGTGNHDVTTSTSVLETITLSSDYNGGVLLRNLSAGDVLVVDGAAAITDFDEASVASAALVVAAGDWTYSNSVLTYFDDAAGAARSIGLVGVSNVFYENATDTFYIV
jgi:hypothetical protein